MKRLIIVAALFALLAAPGRLAAQDDGSRLLASGRTAYEAGDYEKARSDLWAYLEATASLSGASRLPQAEALFTIAQMETDAAVAAQHYATIVDEYPAATVADEALFRLAVYALVTGNPSEARTRFVELRQNYPFSRFQGEIPLWIGRTFLAENSYSSATTSFIEGFGRVRTQDLPYELTTVQRDALAAEYAYWLAMSFQQEGDRETARQYWSLLAYDYPNSPQAADARVALAGGEVPQPSAVPQAVAAASDEDPFEEPATDEELATDVSILDLPDVSGEPAYEVPPGEEEPSFEEPPAMDEEPADEAPPVDAPREEPRVVIEQDAEPAREEPAAPAPTRRPDDEDVFKFPPADGAGESGSAFLQIGAFTSATRAAELSKRLREDGFQSTVEIGIQNGQGFYRVRVGPYRMPVEEPALAATEDRLRRMGYPSTRVAVGS